MCFFCFCFEDRSTIKKQKNITEVEVEEKQEEDRYLLLNILVSYLSGLFRMVLNRSVFSVVLICFSVSWHWLYTMLDNVQATDEWITHKNFNKKIHHH